MVSGTMSTSDNDIPLDAQVSADSTAQQTYTGVVKWFNNKAGFGFITMLDEGEHKNKDIFVHYSSIQVANSQYKYLVKGEYVDFELVHTTTPSAEHEFYAASISGIKGGLLMCETRRNEMVNRPPSNQSYRLPRTNYVPRDTDSGAVAPSRNYRPRYNRDQVDNRAPPSRRPVPDSDGFVRVERRSRGYAPRV